MAIANRWHPNNLNKLLGQSNQLAMKLKAAESY
jgi:hypothetical protein